MAKKEELLKAIVSVEDKATKQFERITKSMQKQNNELLRMKASMEKLRSQSNKKIEAKIDTKHSVKELSKLEKALQRIQRVTNTTMSAMRLVGSGIRRMLPSPTALFAGAIGGGYLGKQVFDNTFLQSAHFEMSQKTIQAMFNDLKKTSEYMKQMEKIAISSPLLNSQDIFGNSKSFIALTKNQKELEKMWDLTERLLAVDPKQGVDGAVFALRELFSGDSQSMAERFELSKKVLNDIKKLPLEKQLKELDKYFNKMGMTKKLVNEMGDTTLGVWNQIKESTEVGLRKIGDPAVKIVKPLLDDLNKALQEGKGNRFIDFGQDMAKGIAKGFVNGTRGIGGWIDSILNDPKFQKLQTVEAKVGFVFEDIHKRFKEWLSNGGKEKITNVSADIISTLATAATQAQKPLMQVGGIMGIAIGQGVLKGAKDYIAQNWWTIFVENNPAVMGANIGRWVVEKVTGKKQPSIKQKYKDLQKDVTQKDWAPGKHPLYNTYRGQPRAFGVQRVPMDNYPIIAHEGERLLTKQQANQEDRKKSAQVVVTGNTFVVREEADIEKVAAALVREINNSRVSFGGVLE
jgi:hypothetical protein